MVAPPAERFALPWLSCPSETLVKEGRLPRRIEGLEPVWRDKIKFTDKLSNNTKILLALNPIIKI